MVALVKDLIGVGFADLQANAVGWNPIAAVSAAGTTTTDATVLKKAQNFVNMTATGSDGVRLPADAPLNKPYIIWNGSGSTGKVYPGTGGTLNGGSADAALSLTTLKQAIFIRYSTLGWTYNLTA
jgi:hypothetical protein